MSVSLILVPYHLGRTGEGSPRGVTVLAETLADERVYEVAVAVDSEATNEIAASMDVIRALAETVRATDGFPFVLAGNCSSAIGTVTGLGGSDERGVIITTRTPASGDPSPASSCSSTRWATSSARGSTS